MANDTNQTLQAKALSTSLTVDDVQKSIRFFEGLGFVTGESWNDDGGKIAGAELKAGNAVIYVMGGIPEGASDPGPGTSSSSHRSPRCRRRLPMRPLRRLFG